jgi:hypothetical protein
MAKAKTKKAGHKGQVAYERIMRAFLHKRKAAAERLQLATAVRNDDAIRRAEAAAQTIAGYRLQGLLS